MSSLRYLVIALALGRSAHGHMAAWHKGMYCLNGTTAGVDDENTNVPVNPLYQLTKDDWWFHHTNQCDEFPPDDGDFLEIPAGGSFTVEIATNRAFTTFSYNGTKIGDFGDGGNYTDLGVTPAGEEPQCITELNIHAQNESMAAGTIFAISYQSDMKDVTPENLVVFSVLPNTPWKRIATYDAPSLPACPDAGCICAWGWVANGCGEPNMYMQGFKCKVTGNTGDQALAPATPAVWCEDDQSKCTTGAKQMIYWQQLDGNNIANINEDGVDLAGDLRMPTYNNKTGFSSGAQTDIFLVAGSATPTSIAPSASNTSTDSNQDSAGTSVHVMLSTATKFLSMLFLVPLLM